MQHATVVVSGTKVAQEVGTSRSEVWRLIQQLRGLGVEVIGQPATGYRLKTVPDLLLPEALAPQLKGTIFSKIHHFYKIGSTNTAAAEAANAGAPEGSVFVAEQQTAGRGRGGNKWHSAKSTGIYCSVILRPEMPPSEVAILSLAAGLAVHAAVSSIDPTVRLDLKWPNDVLIGAKKFCGILTEMSGEVTRVKHAIVGIGMNVNQASFPSELEDVATSLRLVTGSEWSRVELCVALLKSLQQEYRNWLEDSRSRESILQRFAQRSSWVRGREVSIEENGAISGITDGLDPRGFLLVRTAQGVRTVMSGTVRSTG
jgi:BirA family biotin operon repressor/biotin-[acetyl-CoA-carboxylase] ligase